MKTMGPARQGAVLLEALVALLLLGLVASGAAWTSAELLRGVQRIEAREEEARGANRLMAAVSLWPVDDLDRHLGETPQDRWSLLVQRPQPALYHVRVADRVSGAILLETWLFRGAP